MAETPLEELRRLSAEATAGEWIATDKTLSGDSLCDKWPSSEVWSVTTDPTRAGWETDSGCPGYGISKANAAFIVAAVNLARRLADPATLGLIAKAMEDATEAAFRAPPPKDLSSDNLWRIKATAALNAMVGKP